MRVPSQGARNLTTKKTNQMTRGGSGRRGYIWDLGINLTCTLNSPIQTHLSRNPLKNKHFARLFVCSFPGPKDLTVTSCFASNSPMYLSGPTFQFCRLLYRSFSFACKSLKCSFPWYGIKVNIAVDCSNVTIVI